MGEVVPPVAVVPVAEQYKSIGGWLILVAIGIVSGPFRLLFILLTIHGPVISQGTLAELTNPANPDYHPLFGPLFIFEVIVNVIFLIWSAANLYWFFRRRSFFPKVYILFLIANLWIMILDHVLENMIPFIAANYDGSDLEDIFKAFVGAFIWIPYFLVSRRVKGTFIH